MRILIGTSLLTHVDANVYANHTALYYHLGRIAEQRKWEFIQMAPTRLSIDRMRNEAAKTALQYECDYLVFIDDDMLLDPKTIETLIDANKDIVMAHTFIRGYPFNPMSFRREVTEDPADIKLVFEEDVEGKAEDNLCECYAIGFATVAIKTQLLRLLDPPWFITGPNGTEDIYFCLRCKQELGEHIGIFTHTGVPTHHKLDPEFVGKSNVEKLKEFYKPKDVENSVRPGDRGEEYHNKVQALEINVGEKLSFGDKI